MNYIKHYTLLIARAQGRIVDGYTEKHHIIPRCMGGTDAYDNIVRLTPEEHYLAHQLLVKIHPENHALKKSANMMCVKSVNQKRNNKVYGWIKRISRPLGSANGMYGRTHTDEVRNKLSKLATERLSGRSYEELYGKEKSDSLKLKRSIKRKEYIKENPTNGSKNPNAKSYKITAPDGVVYNISGGLVKFCKENKLLVAGIINVAKGRRENYKGWKITYI